MPPGTSAVHKNQGTNGGTLTRDLRGCLGAISGYLGIRRLLHKVYYRNIISPSLCHLKGTMAPSAALPQMGDGGWGEVLVVPLSAHAVRASEVALH